MRQAHGITLIELLLALAIGAVLVGLAAPGFGEAQRNARRTAAVNGFLQAVYFARSEAIKRAAVASLCKSTNGARCENEATDWSGGWIVFVNRDRDQPPEVDPGELVLRAHAPEPGLTIRSNRQFYSFRPFGQLGVTGTTVFCDDRGSRAARAVIISQTGRPRVSDRDASGKPLLCAT